jgi:soluble lytic murein transglycosylase
MAFCCPETKNCQRVGLSAVGHLCELCLWAGALPWHGIRQGISPPMRSLAFILSLFLGVLAPMVRAEDSPFADVVAAMADDDWVRAFALAEGASPVAQDIVTWSWLRATAQEADAIAADEDEEAVPQPVPVFADYVRFLEANPEWPGLDRLRARGEEVIVTDEAPEAVLAYFADRVPQTGQGAVRLAAALYEMDKGPEADTVLREAWLGLGLTPAGQKAMIDSYPDVLASLHTERTDAMLWRWRTSDAERMLPLLDEDQQALAAARIALISDAGGQAAKVAEVPEALRDHPGLAYDRFNRLADDGDYTDAIEILAARSTSAEELGDPFRWASWRATLARWAMREGRPDQAYALASRHFLTEGESYVDLEWVAGFVALTFLDDPARAATHFAAVEAGAGGPISLARGGYWAGRAAEAQGQFDIATAAFSRAAQYQTAFYGLLAAERLGLPLDPALAGREVFPDWQQAGFLQSDLTQAMLLLMGAEERGSAVLFATRLAQTLDRTGIGQLGAMLAAMDEPFFGVLVGKAATERGIIIPAVSYPLHQMAAMDLPVAPALALSIARRESEFNATVGSPVGALGLMQLMPATAEEVAGEIGLPYSRARLTEDWAYNATLGARYLANLQEMFGPSPVMIAAGYNAGPSRPRTWMTQRGDPRTGAADVVEWIEMIPFTETRNYVMRVTETIPIYQARLTGEAGPLAFAALLNGAKPRVRPQARPDPTVSDDVVGSAVETSSAPLRPQARP